MTGQMEPNERLSQCARCGCGVPLDEWEFVPPAAWRHVGPRRDDRIDKFGELDDRGGTACSWVKPVPEKVQ